MEGLAMPSDREILSIDRAMRLIRCMADLEGPAGVTELSDYLEVPKATVFRILYTLSNHDVVIQDPKTDKYILGPTLLKISDNVQINPSLLLLARPSMERLAANLREVVNIGVIHKRRVLLLDSISIRQDSRLVVRLGPIADAHSSSLGKALLARSSTEKIRSILGEEPFPAHTSNTSTSLMDFQEELENVRERGFSVDNEESEYGLMCVGTPIFDWSGNTIAAISVSAPKARMLDKPLEEIGEELILAGEEISQRLQSEVPRVK